MDLFEVNGSTATLFQCVHHGDVLERLTPDTIEPEINPNICVLFEDDDVFILNKPAPLPIHPCGRYNKNSVTILAKIAWPDLTLRPAHRIDADTTGLAVFSKNKSAAGWYIPSIPLLPSLLSKSRESAQQFTVIISFFF
jgi:23S rRNA pseudouridine1911/1915/1917 synthase